MEKEKFLQDLKVLVEQYNQIVSEERCQDFNEADVGSKFILPFFEMLGWNIRNIDEVKEQRSTLSGPADYTLDVNGNPKIIVEIKKFSEDLDNKRTVRGKKESFPEQAHRYAWWLKVDWFILTNFKEIRLYYSRVKKPEDGLVFKLTTEEFLDNYEKLWIISRESVISGDLDDFEKRRSRTEVDKEFLEDLIFCRKQLVTTIRRNNAELSINLLKESVQKILDRILVIRIAEDRGVIGADSLWNELDSWKNRGLPTPFMRKLKTLFRDFDDVYNGKVFETHISEDLIVENAVLEGILNRLYKYNFTFIPSDVLGAIYEDYLGHILTEGDQTIDIVKNHKKRKKKGIYYTPHQIVEYVIRRVLKIYFENKTLEEISSIKVIDPSCGSGSFLIKTFDVIKEHYEDLNLNLAKEEKGILKFSKMFHQIEKKILKDNIYGVDYDSQATEIAVVNLMLKALKKGETLPILLGNNIKCGNSLISGDEDDLKRYFGDSWSDLKPFNWEKEFPDIFINEGFDIIVGNPPHGAGLSKEERNYFSDKFKLTKGYKNTAILFIEQSFNIMREGGILGLIIPKSLTFSQKWNPTRNFLIKNSTIIEIVDLSKAFQHVLLEQIILICRKGKPTSTEYIGKKLYLTGKSEESIIPINQAIELEILPINLDPDSLNLYHKIRVKSVFLSEISNTFRGLPIQSKLKNIKSESTVPILKGADIRPYHTNDPQNFVEAEVLKKHEKKIKIMSKPKIMSQRIVAHVLNPKDHIIIMSTLDQKGIINVDTIENTILNTLEYDFKYILAFFNSNFMAWYAYLFVFNRAVRTMDFDNYYVGKLPIYKASKSSQKTLINYVDKMYENIIDYLENKIDFLKEINKKPRLRDKNFDFFYSKVESNKKLVFIQSNLVGKIIVLEIVEDNDDLIIKCDLEVQSNGNKKKIERKDIIRIEFLNPNLRSFIKNSLINHKKKFKKANILKTILNLPIPFYDKNLDKNLEIMTEIMRSFVPCYEKQNEIIDNILKIERQINNEIYSLYGFTEKERSVIEQQFGIKSKVLHLIS